MSAGTGVGSVQTPFSWCFGFVTYSRPECRRSSSFPAGTLRQYCVCTAAQGLPPRFAKNVFR